MESKTRVHICPYQLLCDLAHILYSFKGCVLSNKKPVGGRPMGETGSKWNQKPVLGTPRPQDGPYQLQVSTYAWSRGYRAWSNRWRPYFRTFLLQESWQQYLLSWPWLFPQWWCPSSLPRFQRPRLWPKRRAWRAGVGVGVGPCARGPLCARGHSRLHLCGGGLRALLRL